MNAGLGLLLGAAVVGGAIIFAAREAKADDSAGGDCGTPEDLAKIMGDLSDPNNSQSTNPAALRDIAQILREAEWCDASIAQAAKAAAATLDAKANTLESGSPRVPGPYPPISGPLPFNPPPVPPQQWPIPGGVEIQGIGWCPPGYAYNLATKLCEYQGFGVQTQGESTGTCCASCEVGGPCTGCNNE